MLTLLCGDALTELRKLPSDSVHCVVTSPPYYGLRDYGTAQWEGGDAACDHDQRRRERDPDSKQATSGGSSRDGLAGGRECRKCGARRIDQQLGLERTLDEFLERLVAVFEEVKRVMHPSATCWVNMGDSYCSAPCGNFGPGMTKPTDGGAYRSNKQKVDYAASGLKTKDRMLVPYRLALAMQARGWWLRDIICWHKPAPMPESVTDRCTQSWEPIFMFAKSATYYFDSEAIKETTEPEAWHNSDFRRERNRDLHPSIGNGERNARTATRNPRNLWRISPEPFTWQLCESCGRIYTGSEFAALPQDKADLSSRKLCRCGSSGAWLSHFATFPTDLPKGCVLAGTSAKGVCGRCGEPWVRQVEATEEYEALKASRRGTDSYQSRGLEAGNRFGSDTSGLCKSVKTTGWLPGCTCAAPVVPATVLDPFAGTCSTLVAALELGRRALGIDLNENYLRLARVRCAAITPSLALA